MDWRSKMTYCLHQIIKNSFKWSLLLALSFQLQQLTLVTLRNPMKGWIVNTNRILGHWTDLHSVSNLLSLNDHKTTGFSGKDCLKIRIYYGKILSVVYTSQGIHWRLKSSKTVTPCQKGYLKIRYPFYSIRCRNEEKSMEYKVDFHDSFYLISHSIIAKKN